MKKSKSFGDELFDIAKNTNQSFSTVAKTATKLASQGLTSEETLRRTNELFNTKKLKFRICYTAQNGEKSITYIDDRFLIGLDGQLYENYGKDWKHPFWEVPYDSFDIPIIQQFTGLLDANSKEIFEGDIVKTDLKHMASALGLVPNYTKGYIDWCNESWKVCQSKIGATHLGDFATCHCCNCGLEIIGNVFENPEFLE